MWYQPEVCSAGKETLSGSAILDGEPGSDDPEESCAGSEVPDHSSLTRIRDRLGVEIYKAVFKRIISDLRRKGFIKGKRVVADASIVAADACMDSLVLILDCHVTTGATHECTVLTDRLDCLHDELNLPIGEVIADKGYDRGPTYRYLKERGIRAYIPLHDDNLGEGRISRGEFRYDRRNDRFVCPNGKFLYPYEKCARGLKRYRVVGGHCKSCPLKAACLPPSHKSRARFVYRSQYQDEIDSIKRRQGTAHFKKKLAERRWKIEGLFGEAKENHCLRRARYRSLGKVQIQLYMTAIVQNLKRLVSRLLHFLRRILHRQSRFGRQGSLSARGVQEGELFVVELQMCA